MAPGISSWALPVAVVAGIYLVREAKATGPETVEYIEDLVNDSITRVQDAGADLLDSAASSGAYYGEAAYEAQYEAQRRAVTEQNILDAQRIEAAVLAPGGLAPGQRSGCVTGTLGGYCGKWKVSQAEASSDTPPDSCHVIGTGARGGFTKYFVGTYCRDARAQGLIGPRGTISGYTQFNLQRLGWAVAPPTSAAIDPGLR